MTGATSRRRAMMRIVDAALGVVFWPFEKMFDAFEAVFDWWESR